MQALNDLNAGSETAYIGCQSPALIRFYGWRKASSSVLGARLEGRWCVSRRLPRFVHGRGRMRLVRYARGSAQSDDAQRYRLSARLLAAGLVSVADHMRVFRSMGFFVSRRFPKPLLGRAPPITLHSVFPWRVTVSAC
jgi:hypothetical protein